MLSLLRPAIALTVLMTLLTGLVYPVVVFFAGDILFPRQARGNLIVRDGTVVGAELLGQGFTKPEYFHPRPSAADADGYDAAASSGSNLGPTNKTLIERVRTTVAELRKENPTAPIPVDMVTTSASGLDPHISLAAAEFQIPRIARARGVSEADLRTLVERHLEKPFWRRDAWVNVLKVNLALDEE